MVDFALVFDEQNKTAKAIWRETVPPMDHDVEDEAEGFVPSSDMVETSVRAFERIEYQGAYPDGFVCFIVDNGPTNIDARISMKTLEAVVEEMKTVTKEN